MDKQALIHYCQILVDKLDAIQQAGLSLGRIHTINSDRGLLINNVFNMDSKWFDEKIKDKAWAEDYEKFVNGIIKRVEDDLISFVYPTERRL